MSISKKRRFEIFKRDKFICQYCGQSAPDIILQIDHIQPVSKGGTDDILNLITSCRECNYGKRDRLLSDDTVIKRQKQQLDDLQERREQLNLLMQWQRELAGLDQETMNKLTSFWDDLVPGYHLNESGHESLKKYLRRFEVAEIAEAMRISTNQYLQYNCDEDDNPIIPTKESVEKAWEYVGRICACERRNKEKPYMKDLYYTRGILRNRCHGLGRSLEWKCIELMEQYVLAGITIKELQTIAKRINSYHEFEEILALPATELANYMAESKTDNG